MNHNRSHVSGDVPFSWESKPGASMVTPHMGEEEFHMAESPKLPPPPCPTHISSSKFSGHGIIHIPLPPCPFQPPLRSTSNNNNNKKKKKGFVRSEEEDPFTAAYMECTKNGSVRKQGKGKRRHGFGLSCKHTCEVVEHDMAR